MSQNYKKYGWQFYFFLGIVFFLGFFIITIPLNIAIARRQYPEPQAILCLGGSGEREIFAAKLASQNPELVDRTKRDRETKTKIIRDIGRSVLWLFSGYTGANLKDI